jgi:opacity protein-like surface antigen
MLAKPFLIAAALAAALALSGAPSAYAAAVQWNGAGWYGIDGNLYWEVLVNGPFVDEATCKANLPADDADSTYFCEYLSERSDRD